MLAAGDKERVRDALACGWTGERGLQRICEKLVSDTREDEATKRVMLENRLALATAQASDLGDTNRKLRREFEQKIKKPEVNACGFST